MQQQPKTKAPRIYYLTPDPVAACKDGLIWDRYKAAFFSTEPEVYDNKYVRSDIKQWDEVPEKERMYLKSEFKDVLKLKSFKCRYEPIYRLWYCTSKQWEEGMIPFEAMYPEGHFMRYFQ
jgi:hypothetical protein